MEWHRGRRVKLAAGFVRRVRFNDLDPEVQRDVAMCARDMLLVELGVTDAEDPRYIDDPDDVIPALAQRNPNLPIWGVNPKLLAACEQRSLEDVRLEAYDEAWREGVQFPPVVIDMSQEQFVLCEGGHRSCSAATVGVPKILAIDLAGLRLKPLLKELGL